MECSPFRDDSHQLQLSQPPPHQPSQPPLLPQPSAVSPLRPVTDLPPLSPPPPSTAPNPPSLSLPPAPPSSPPASTPPHQPPLDPHQPPPPPSPAPSPPSLSLPTAPPSSQPASIPPHQPPLDPNRTPKPPLFHSVFKFAAPLLLSLLQFQLQSGNNNLLHYRGCLFVIAICVLLYSWAYYCYLNSSSRPHYSSTAALALRFYTKMMVLFGFLTLGAIAWTLIKLPLPVPNK